MGMPTAQAGQPISQQQPNQPQGKGSSSHPLHGTAYEQINPQLQQTAYGPTLGENGLFGHIQSHLNNPVIDSVVSGTPQQVNSSQNLGQLLGNGKGSSQMTQSPHPIGKGNTTNSTTSGQPQIGQPNTYSNTVGPWDNSNTQPQVQSGKGKGH